MEADHTTIWRWVSPRAELRLESVEIPSLHPTVVPTPDPTSTTTLTQPPASASPTMKNPMTDRIASAVGYTSRRRISGGGTSHAFDEPASRWRTAATTR